MSEGMVCSECGKELPTATRRTETAGGLTYFAGNRFCHSHLTKEAAQLRRSKARGSKEERTRSQDLASAVLKALPLLPDPDQEHARTLLIQEAARLTSGSGASALSAVSTLSGLVGNALIGGPKMRRPADNEVCPLCDRKPFGSVHISLDPKLAAHWMCPEKLIPYDDADYARDADEDAEDGKLMAVED